MKTSLGPKTLVYPTPVFVVGSYGEGGRPNMMTASWGGICCSDPPSVAVSIREGRLTYANIMRTRAFTIGLPSAANAAQADYVGTVSGRDENKFEKLGLTAVRAEYVDAPYASEFPMVLECRLAHTFNLGAHTQFVGQILDVKIDESLIGEDGEIDMAALAPIAYAPGVSGYYRLGEFLGRAFSIGREKS